MEIDFDDKSLDRLYYDQGFIGRWSRDIARQYRKRIQYIIAAQDERDLYALKSLHYEKLKGARSHQRSMKLNDQYRLIIELCQEQGSNRVAVRIVSIEDYH